MAIDPESLRGELALELDAESVTAGEFQAALDAFLVLVREVTRQINDTLPQDAWLLTVQEGSQVVALRPDDARLSPSISDAIRESVLMGVNALESEPKKPRYFTDSALEAARTLSRIAQGRKDEGVPLRLVTRTSAAKLTRSTYNHVSQILDWQYEDLGTVDGILKVVSAATGYEFRIYEPIWDRAVRCTFNDEELLREGLQAFKRRVEVQGLVRYTKDGFPLSIKAVKITPFPDAKDLPSFRAVRGILSDGA